MYFILEKKIYDFFKSNVCHSYDRAEFDYIIEVKEIGFFFQLLTPQFGQNTKRDRSIMAS